MTVPDLRLGLLPQSVPNTVQILHLKFVAPYARVVIPKMVQIVAFLTASAYTSRRFMCPLVEGLYKGLDTLIITQFFSLLNLVQNTVGDA